MRALTLTLLLSLPYTLVVLGIAGVLSVAETITLFSANISTAMLKTLLLLLLASFFQPMSEPGGLANGISVGMPGQWESYIRRCLGFSQQGHCCNFSYQVQLR